MSAVTRVSKCRNELHRDKAFPARTWTPFQNAHFPWTCGESTLPSYLNFILTMWAPGETDGNETLDEPPGAGGAHTRCSGILHPAAAPFSFRTGSVLLVLHSDCIQQPCAHLSVPPAGNLHREQSRPCLLLFLVCSKIHSGFVCVLWEPSDQWDSS